MYMQQRTSKSIEGCNSSQIERFEQWWSSQEEKFKSNSSQIERFEKWWSSKEENFKRGLRLQMKKKMIKPGKTLPIKRIRLGKWWSSQEENFKRGTLRRQMKKKMREVLPIKGEDEKNKRQS